MRKLNVKSASVKVTSSFYKEGSVLKGTMAAGCPGFDLEVAIESEEEPAQVAELLRIAHDSCFTEAALRDPVPIHSTHLLNGRPLAVPS